MIYSFNVFESYDLIQIMLHNSKNSLAIQDLNHGLKTLLTITNNNIPHLTLSTINVKK